MTVTAIVENQKVRTTTGMLIALLVIFAVVLAVKYGLISAFFEWLGKR